jgi:hypothetical protein
MATRLNSRVLARVFKTLFNTEAIRQEQKTACFARVL